jgi:epoxyqueuosine reductase
VSDAAAAPETLERLKRWLAEGRQGDMLWMAETPERRADPTALWPEVRSILMLGVSYAPECDALGTLDRKKSGSIALYARRRDYHETIKGRLKELAGFLAAKGGGDVKVFVDTAPVMEKVLAARAGLGWQGKNTMLVSRVHGDWLLLGAIYATLELPKDEPEGDHCGSCARCLDVCPTRAFPAPYQLDARRCIAYLTIEHKGVIPAEFREAMGNRIFGCDDCLAVCPWNKFAAASRAASLAARAELEAPDLAMLAGLDDVGFRKLFAGTPMKRTGRDRFLRNVLIALGNSGDPELARVAEARLDDSSPLVRGMAVWALARLAPQRFRALRRVKEASEPDAGARREWAMGDE